MGVTILLILLVWLLAPLPFLSLIGHCIEWSSHD